MNSDDYETLPTDNVVTHMIAGAIAGVMEHCVMYPLDSVKTRMQSLTASASEGIGETLLRMVRCEGLLRPVRGMSAMVVGAGPSHALYFSSYEYLKNTLTQHTNNARYHTLIYGGSGCIATLIHDGFMNPAEVVKQRMQMQNSPYKSALQCACHVYKTEGPRAFYRSYTTQLTMNVPFQSIHFMVYEFSQKVLNSDHMYNPAAHMVSGALAGGVAAAVTTPLDVCKTLLNTQQNGDTKGLIQAVKAVYRLGGPTGYFRAPCSGASGIRPPSGLRPPGTRMPQRSPRAQSATQTSSICPAASASRLQPPGAMGRPSGIQQPSGMSRLQPPSAGRPSAIAGPSRPSGLQPPRTIGRPGGIPGPSGRPSGLQPPKPCGAVKPPCPGTTVPADIVSAEAEASQKIAEKQLRKPGKRVIAKAIVTRLPVDPGTIDTPEGPQPVVMQTTLEQRVERDETGEKVTKNLGITNVDVCTGVHKKISMGIQQMNPKYARYGGKEVIEATSKVSATENYATVQQITSRAITTTVSEAADLTGADIAQLVEEEKEDVDNTLKMLPPDLTARPGRYKMKQRLQKLRLNSESVALLEQSIIQPTPTADEAQTDPSPEAMAKMMHTVEKGVPPQSTPDQVFHSLFSETSNEKYVKLSAVSQGPLQDVVVPTEMPREVHQEVVSEEMNKLTEKLGGISDAEEVPYTDIFTKVMDDAAKSPTKGKNKESEFPVIGDEKSLWVNADLQHLVNIVGAEPAEVLDPLDISALAEEDGRLEQEMAKGVQYYIDADPVQYMSRVQLRGTMPPSYFPGYIVALPEFVEVVRLARSPDEVFASAWKSVQPKYFEDDSMQSLLF